jgi:hypothetical protein
LGEPFHAVLDNLMTNYWPPADDDDWLGDEAGYDAPRYSTELLYPLGRDEGNPLYVERADKTVDFVVGIAGLQHQFQKIADGQSLDEEAASLPANLYGHRYYSGSSPYDFSGEWGQRAIPRRCL